MKKIKTKTVTAILYIRVASKHQDDVKKSFARQEKELKAYCKRKNIIITKIVTDNASGTTFKRVEFEKLLNELKAGNIKSDLLLFTSWGRFSRNASLAGMMIPVLKQLGISAESINEKFDKESLLLNEFSFLVNNRLRKERINSGIAAAKRMGRWVSLAPFGYKNTLDDKKMKIIEPDENSQKIKCLFEEFSTGNYTVNEITRKFNTTAPMASRAKILEVLKNPVYMGMVVVKKSKGSYPELVIGIHTPLVSIELFNIVQGIIKNLLGNKNNNK